MNRPLFIVADAFSKSATAKIEAAGGSAHVLEFPVAGEYEPGEAAEAAEPAAPAAKKAAPAAKKAAPADEPAAPAEKEAAPAAPAKPKKAAKPAVSDETLPPTSSADEAGSEA